MTKHLSQLELNTISINDSELKFKVNLKLEDTNEVVVNLSSNLTQDLNNFKVGTSVLGFNESNDFVAYGILRSVSRSLNKILVYFPNKNDLDQITSVSLDSWWKPKTSASKIISNVCFLEAENTNAELEASCTYTNHLPGLISWSLSYIDTSLISPERILVLAGHDYESVGVCKYTKNNALWKAGTYILQAERYSKISTLIKKDAISWVLKDSISVLSCGGYSSLPPLYL